jgi:UPF0755 protein
MSLGIGISPKRIADYYEWSRITFHVQITARGRSASFCCSRSAAIVAWLVRWYVDRPLKMSADRIEFKVLPVLRCGHRTVGAPAGIEVDRRQVVVVARVTGTSQTLRAGRYGVERGITLGQLLAKLRAGDVLRERLTLVEGITFKEMKAHLASQPELKQDAALMTPGELLLAIEAAEPHPEGLFAPETYVYDPGTNDLEIYHQAYRSQMKTLQEAWRAARPIFQR